MTNEEFIKTLDEPRVVLTLNNYNELIENDRELKHTKNENMKLRQKVARLSVELESYKTRIGA